MKEALWHLLDDFLSAVLFLLAYAVSGSLRAAVGVVALFAAGAAAGAVLRRRRLERLRWASLGLLLALAAAAWLFDSPRFIMARPSAVHLLLAAAMSQGDWMYPYLNNTAQQNAPRGLIVTTSYGWAVLMAALGFTNLIIALYFDLRVWTWFVVAISPGVKLAALALQYAVFRGVVRRRLAQAATPTAHGLE